MCVKKCCFRNNHWSAVINITSVIFPVNNAGIGMSGALETQTMDMTRKVFETNFFGVLRLTKAVLSSMKSNRDGHIICVTSMGGIFGTPFNSVYCSSKFAVEGLIESLAPMLRSFNVR